jgi:hypothetical protein
MADPAREIDDRLEQLIVSLLDAKYVGESCKAGIQTGNKYQPVKLRETIIEGFRTDRAHILDQIDFAGKNVLDLGSNLGELSRDARSRGASLVDGYEYDAFFLRLANLINAYNLTTRVSFHQRDITDPSIYTEPYDVVLAFSVFSYVSPVMDRIADITRDVLILETHKLESNLEQYVRSIRRFLPHFELLGQTEWGGSGEGDRAVIAFAKEEGKLRSTLRSSVPVRGGPSKARQKLVRSGYLDVRRTTLQERFFAKFQADSSEELFSTIESMPVDVDTLAQDYDLRRSVYSGWSYWLIYLKGYLAYRKDGTIDEGNPYFAYLTKYYAPRGHDPGLSRSLADPEGVRDRVIQRFRDFEIFGAVAREQIAPEELRPVRLLITDPSEQPGLRLFELDSDKPLMVNRVDGWHRLFAAKIWGVERVPFELVRT